MDANRQRFWMLADSADWGENSAVEYDDRCRVLRLRDRRRGPFAGAVMAGTVSSLLTTPARTVDEFGTVAYWDSGTRRLLANGALHGVETPVTLLTTAPNTGRFPRSGNPVRM